MIFRVLQIYREGVRLPREALRAAEPILGVLVVEDWREGNAQRRALRVARLKHPTVSYSPELLPPLFDPVLTRCDPRGMVLYGFQCESRPNRAVANLMQGWWLTQQVL